MEFTGERYVPGIGGNIALEHEHRYRSCLPFVRGRRVLDIASGEGFGSAIMAEAAEHVFGVDIDREAVAHAVRTYSKENLTYLNGSATAIPIEDASVDVVVSFETVEHLKEHDLMMSEIRRVLRPNGVLIISSPDKRTYSDERNFANQYHVREMYEHEFRTWLSDSFRHVRLFGQRIVYGSAILPDSGRVEIRSWGIGKTEATPGMDAPIYHIAVASDDPTWLEMMSGGLLEESVFRSEAVAEKHRLSISLELKVQKLEAEAIAHRERFERISKNFESLAAINENFKLSIDELTKLVQAPSRKSTELAVASGDIEHARTSYYTATALRRLSFHKNGRPRGWLRSILLKDKQGTPRPIARHILFKKNGKVRPKYEKWYYEYLRKHATAAKHNNVIPASESKGLPTAAPQSLTMSDTVKAENAQAHYRFLLDQIGKGHLWESRSLHIITTQHTDFIAQCIIRALRDTRFKVTWSNEMPQEFSHDIYIVLTPQMFDRLPPAERRILFQMEQVRASNWMTPKYLADLQSSLAVLDYSHDNIDALQELGLSSRQLNFVPIRPHPMTPDKSSERDIDVLFYGATGCQRRRDFLDRLSEKMTVRIEDNIFGEELRALLNRTKVVINVHYYENALLETTRLSEALSHGAFVVSEKASDQAEHSFFEDKVRFVEIGNVDGFVQAVQDTLASWNEPIYAEDDNSTDGMTYHVLRALHGIRLMSISELIAACPNMKLPARQLVLALPEQSARYRHARRNLLPETQLFHGLKNPRGWRGCAESYKFLATLALSNGFDRIGIFEDDAAFEPDAAERLSGINSFLDQHEKDWDIFSGLLTDLDKDASILDITETQMGEIVTLDSVIGMVFGIYNRSALEKIAEFEILGTDTAIYTIDRYLESWRPCCLTVQPPLAEHSNELESVLWTNSNNLVTPTIERSVARLAEKVQQWRRENTER